MTRSALMDMEEATTTGGAPVEPPANPGRYERYSGILDPQRLRSSSVVVVGCGSIGRRIALLAAQIGFGRISLVDHDVVDEVNLGTQGFRPDQIGASKTSATKDDCLRLAPDAVVRSIPLLAPHSSDSCLVAHKSNGTWGDILFVTTDSQRSRREIHEAVLDARRPPSLLVDVRMLREAFQVHSHVPPFGSYAGTLFDDAEALPGTCSTRTTGHGASTAASMAMSLATRSLRGIEVPRLVECDLLALILRAE